MVQMLYRIRSSDVSKALLIPDVNTWIIFINSPEHLYIHRYYILFIKHATRQFVHFRFLEIVSPDIISDIIIYCIYIPNVYILHCLVSTSRKKISRPSGTYLFSHEYFVSYLRILNAQSFVICFYF